MENNLEIKDKKIDNKKEISIKENSNNEIQPESIITYSKYNKFIFKTKNNNSFNEKENRIYNILKYGLALFLGLFLIISLWMSTIWQSNTLVGLGVNLTGINEKYTGIPKLTQLEIDAMNAKAIFEFNGLDLNIAWLNSIVSISIISLIFIVPILLFKNGTLFSIISISFGFILFITLLSLFFIGMIAQSELVMISRDGNFLASKTPLSPTDQTELNSILEKIIAIVGK